MAVPTTRHSSAPPSARATELIQWGVSKRVQRLLLPVLGLVLASLFTGCARSEPPARAIRLSSFRQAGQAGVFLNETLVLHFDSELDRSSVTRSSVSIKSESGSEAHGKLEAQGSSILFTPDAPLLADFSDGGLLPGERYRVVVSGFPNPDGVRGRGGEPLVQTCVRTFETIGANSPPGPRFADLSPDRAEPLQLEAVELSPFEPIRVRCGEPIDPSTLFAEDFLLQVSAVDVIPLRADLLSNDEEGALIELRPVDGEGQLRALPVGSLWLWMKQSESRLRDFGGHPVLPVWLGQPSAGRLEVLEQEDALNVGTYVESFIDQSRRSPEQVAESAGTAHWADGVVSIRFPAAAGTGEAGRVVLSGEEGRSELHTTELSVPSGKLARLTGDGLVVLRSQGRMTIDGSLRRDVEGKQREAEGLGLRDYAEWHRWADEREEWDVPGMHFRERESLSHWLAEAAELDLAWTVLIAGGDLVVRGELWFDGPLLLIAGGRILINGEIRRRPLQLWTLPKPLSSRTATRPRLAPLYMDAPITNPLQEPLTWTVKSTPPPSPSGAKNWRLVAVQGEDRGGEIRIGYIGERHTAGSVITVGPVDRPELLEGCSAIRMRIDLTVGSKTDSARWDPPILDTVELAWEETELDR